MNDMINAILYREPRAPQGTPPLLLFFSEVAVKDERASKNGPPVFVPVHQVRVVVAGSRSNEGPIYELARKQADGTWKTDTQAYSRFGKPYEDWKSGQTSGEAGTPLDQWGLMDVAMVAAFKAANVYTVQQLALLPDGLLDTAIRRGGREWRGKAQAWLQEAKDKAGDVEARATIERQQEQINQLMAQVAEMQRKGNKEALGYDKPKRGRQIREDVEETVDVVDEPDRRL